MSQDPDFIQLIYKADVEEVYKYLKRTNTKPHLIKDEKKYTALHIASLNGTYALLEFLITYTKRNNKD